MFVYVGGYTTPDASGRPRGEGIGVFRLADATGALSPVQTVRDIVNPSYLVLGAGGRNVYAVREVSDTAGGKHGAIEAFARDQVTGRLTLLNQQPSHGADPCHLSVDGSGRFLFAANYTSGSIACFPLGPRGELRPASQVHQHHGIGLNPGRQAGPHAHAILPDPTNHYVLAVDLGLDRVLVYQFDSETGALQPHDPPAALVNGGSGPRHLAFAPNTATAYLVHELDSTLSASAWNAEAGTLHTVGTWSTLPEGYVGISWAAAVRVAPSGRYVYASNRGHDSIAIFQVDDDTGGLTPRGHVSSGGRTPRDFALSPDGALLLAANQASGTLVAFNVDRDSGALSATGAVTPFPTPTCVLFAV